MLVVLVYLLGLFVAVSLLAASLRLWRWLTCFFLVLTQPRRSGPHDPRPAAGQRGRDRGALALGGVAARPTGR